MTQNFSPFLRGFSNPHDLFRVAWDFLHGFTTANTFGVSFTTYPFALSASQQLSNQWAALMASVPVGFQGTLLRCINANLRCFNPKIKQQLYAIPLISMALERAKTDRTDVRVVPTVITPLLSYSYYASLADTFGAPGVQSAVAGGQLLMVGIRNASGTMANKGIGSYDDAIVVVKGVGAARMSATFPACTEPSAQYAQRAAVDPKSKTGERVDPRYADVTKKYDKNKKPKNDGVDVNADGILDAGRLVAGTYQYAEKSHGHLGARAFRVGSRIQKGKKSIFVSGPSQVVERDTDGDGLFSNADPSRIDPSGAGTSMYIHQGGSDAVAHPNTWSAGCQTIPKNRYGTFLTHIPVNATFYFVLINAGA